MSNAAEQINNPDLIATMCMGQLWCPDHSEYDQEDLDQAYVVEITQFDLDCATPQAEWLIGSCCHGCGSPIL